MMMRSVKRGSVHTLLQSLGSLEAGTKVTVRAIAGAVKTLGLRPQSLGKNVLYAIHAGSEVPEFEGRVLSEYDLENDTADDDEAWFEDIDTSQLFINMLIAYKGRGLLFGERELKQALNAPRTARAAAKKRTAETPAAKKRTAETPAPTKRKAARSMAAARDGDDGDDGDDDEDDEDDEDGEDDETWVKRDEDGKQLEPTFSGVKLPSVSAHCASWYKQGAGEVGKLA